MVCCVALALGACTGETPSAQDLARSRGLLPAAVPNTPLNAPPVQIMNPGLRAMHLALQDPSKLEVPKPPELHDYSYLLTKRPASTYRGWNTDRVDASTFETLTTSLNTIYAKMGPEMAADFDAMIKVITLNLGKHPLVAKKAVSGGAVTDEELLDVARSFLHQRTPYEIAATATAMLQAQRQQSPMPQAMPMPASAPPVMFDRAQLSNGAGY